MAKQSIKSELGKTLVNIALCKIDLWAKKEFDRIRYQEELPICVPISNRSWAVGQFEIHQRSQNQWELRYNNEIKHTFYSKQSAIFYSVFTNIRNYKHADKILSQDTKVSKYHEDLEFYTKKLQQKSVLKDVFRRELFTSRFLEAKSDYDLAKSELEKTLTTAKYIKIWDTLL